MNSSSSPDTESMASVFEGAPTVLVADDEELMREVVAMMIEDNGGKVLLASDGQKAVEVFEENKDVVDYVFMDFSMPGLNGYEAYLQMKRLKPSVRVLFVSGLKITPEIRQLQQKGEVEFLSKPFLEQQLLEALQKLKDKE